MDEFHLVASVYAGSLSRLVLALHQTTFQAISLSQTNFQCRNKITKVSQALDVLIKSNIFNIIGTFYSRLMQTVKFNDVNIVNNQ